MDAYDSSICFKQKYDSAVAQYIPEAKFVSECNKPWINETSRKAIKKKSCAYARCKERTNYTRYTQYLKARDNCTKTLRAEQNRYENKLLGKIKENPRAFYKHINRKKSVKCPVCNLEKDNGEITRTDFDTAEELNNFFVSVFNKEEDSDILTFNESFQGLFGEDCENPLDLHLPANFQLEVLN